MYSHRRRSRGARSPPTRSPSSALRVHRQEVWNGLGGDGGDHRDGAVGGGGRVPGGVTRHTAVVAVVTGQVRVDEALVGVGVGVGLQGHGQAVGGARRRGWGGSGGGGCGRAEAGRSAGARGSGGCTNLKQQQNTLGNSG